MFCGDELFSLRQSLFSSELDNNFFFLFPVQVSRNLILRGVDNMDAKERIVGMTDVLHLVAILMSLPPDLFSF